VLRAPDPPLAGEIVALRPPEPGDVPALAVAANDPGIARWTTVPQPYGPDEAARFISVSASGWRRGTVATFVMVWQGAAAVARLGTRAPVPGSVVGAVDLKLAWGEGASTGEAGYWVAAPVRGCGVATEALSLVVEWAFADLGLSLVTLSIRDGNDGSVAVARRTGFSAVGAVEASGRRETLAVRVFARWSPAAAGPRGT
jgi:RimJ/RimL family protein N-acetyltransferase